MGVASTTSEPEAVGLGWVAAALEDCKAGLPIADAEEEAGMAEAFFAFSSFFFFLFFPAAADRGSGGEGATGEAGGEGSKRSKEGADPTEHRTRTM